MDLQTLRFFVAAADAGSFSAAAENLHYAQSNLSNRIKQLEEELGEPLFYRHKRGVSLTAKGKVFYDYTLMILVGSEEAGNEDSEEILANAPLITFPEGSAFRRSLELLLSSRSLSYMDRLTVLNSLGAMITNICAGIGCGYLPRSIVASYMERGLMVEYPLENPFSKLDVVFIYRKDHVQDAAFRYFLDRIKL